MKGPVQAGPLQRKGCVLGLLRPVTKAVVPVSTHVLGSIQASAHGVSSVQPTLQDKQQPAQNPGVSVIRFLLQLLKASKSWWHLSG